MKQGHFYALGVGPGDPELMTLKAARILEGCEVVCAPDRGTAFEIARDYLSGKTLLPLELPMTKDPEILERAYQEAVDKIRAELLAGHDVAYVCLGDPSIYSTVMSVHGLLSEEGFSSTVVPGVPSFTAAACALGIPLCERGERLTLLPGTYVDESWTEIPGTKVLMKSGRRLGELAASLPPEQVYAAEKVSLEDERLYRGPEGLSEAGYFTLLILKES